jgi:hypothetical protein
MLASVDMASNRGCPPIRTRIADTRLHCGPAYASTEEFFFGFFGARLKLCPDAGAEENRTPFFAGKQEHRIAAADIRKDQQN